MSKVVRMMLHKKVPSAASPRGGKVLASSCVAMLAFSPLLVAACTGTVDGGDEITPLGVTTAPTPGGGDQSGTAGASSVVTGTGGAAVEPGNTVVGPLTGTAGAAPPSTATGGMSAPVGTGGTAPPAGTGGARAGGRGTGGAASPVGTGGARTAGTGGAAPPVGTGGQPGGVPTPPPDGNSDAFLGGFFPIAVDGPRPDDYHGSTDCSASPATGDYAGWSSCGVNTIARGPDCSDTSCPTAFDAQVTAAGLHMIRAPLPNPAQDVAKHAADHLLLAWTQMDEPDANGGLAGNLPGLTSRYASLTAVAGHPPVYLNVGGSDLMATNQPYQKAFIQTDWVANDIYPVAGFLDDRFMRGDLTLVGKALDKFAEVAPDKPRFAWIETNNILGQGDPTAAQVRAEIWIAIVHGARGILYFQEQVEPDFDLLSTSAAVRTEMGKQHAAITQLAAVLQGAINPAAMGASVAAPLAVGWRQAASGRYIIVVNSTASTVSGAAVTLTGLVGAQAAMVWGESRMVPVVNGRLVDDFGPYARHIYVVP